MGFIGWGAVTFSTSPAMGFWFLAAPVRRVPWAIGGWGWHVQPGNAGVFTCLQAQHCATMTSINMALPFDRRNVAYE